MCFALYGKACRCKAIAKHLTKLQKLKIVLYQALPSWEVTLNQLHMQLVIAIQCRAAKLSKIWNSDSTTLLKVDIREVFFSMQFVVMTF